MIEDPIGAGVAEQAHGGLIMVFAISEYERQHSTWGVVIPTMEDMPRPRKRPPTALSRFLDQALRRNNLTHTAFCAEIGMSPASLSDLKLRNGTVAPGWELVRTWGPVLHLTQAEERELFDLVQLAFTPSGIQEEIRRLRQQNVKKVAEQPLINYEIDRPTPSP